MKPIHDRMPVILSEEAEGLWMRAGSQDPGTLGSVLTPFPAGSMEALAVSDAVNSYRNEGQELTLPRH